MVYHDTRRDFWHGRFTAVNFYLTTVLLGTATLLVSAVCTAAASESAGLRDLLRGWGGPACVTLVTLSAAKLLLGLLPLRHLRDRRHTPMKRTAQLLCGALLRPMLARNVLMVVGGGLLPLLAMSGLRAGREPADFAVLAVGAFGMTLLAEITARYLFFTAVVQPRMPGGLGE
jgi:DMSO reductase anchor subunit